MPKNFCSTRKIFRWNFCIIRNVALSVCLNVMHMTWNVEKNRQCVQKWAMMQFLIGSEFFSWFYRQKMSKIGFLNLCRLFQRPFNRLHKKSYLRFAVPTGLPEEAAENFIWLHSVVDSWSGQGTIWMWNSFFAIGSALSDNILRLSSPEKLPQGCDFYYLLASSEGFCNLEVTLKTIELKYLWIIIEKTRPFWKIFVSGFVVLYITHSCQLLEPRCCETAFGKQSLASVDFSDDKCFSRLNFAQSYDGYLESPLLSNSCFLPNLPRFQHIVSGIS